MTGFDPDELIRAIEEVIPLNERPDPAVIRNQNSATILGQGHLDFVRSFYAVSGQLDRSIRLARVTVESTESDMPVVMSASTPHHDVVIFDRGITGAIGHVSNFLGLSRAVDFGVSASRVTTPPEKPIDLVNAHFFRSYFRSLRWAGNFVRRFDVAPEGGGLELSTIVRYWAITFLLFHEFEHIANADTQSPNSLNLDLEQNADEQALRLVALLARRRPYGEDPGFALIGAQVGLIALSCTEWAFFVDRPQTHLPAPRRLQLVNQLALRERLFPTGSVHWSKDVLGPLLMLIEQLGEPLCPPFDDQYRGILERGRFFLAPPAGIDDACERLAGYESFDRHMSFPLDAQMKILAERLGLSTRDDADEAEKVRSGHAWCEDNLNAEAAQIKAAARHGLGFRDAIELSKSKWMTMPYSARVAGMAWCLAQVGWDPGDEKGALELAWGID